MRSEAADRRLVRTAKTDPIVQRLQSAPQVGPITALAFVAALDGVRRFRNAHQVESYLGLVPRERSSGEHQLRGRIAKTGDKRVRWLLVETAWRLDDASLEDQRRPTPGLDHEDQHPARPDHRGGSARSTVGRDPLCDVAG